MVGSRPGSRATLVHSLATLLRNDGDSVLAGSSTLTLQTSSLQHLTCLFEQYLLSRTQQHGFLALPSHPADTDSLLQLQFLFDVLQKTVSLKLINTPGTRLQSVVKIFPFKSLKHLELKRVPPHCLEGLRGVYSQLGVFTCSKSLSSLEELLSLCGGDLSSALPWLELHTLNFSYNSIVCLDESLSLLNVLKYLDLSHNKIQECAEFLKPLSELEHLNLGYNCLQRTPVLGFTSRAKLLTLILRNNELETINGVEQLCSLQHLDLAYNLLMEHSQLAPLSLLHCLNTLTLEGNPLFFQRGHRASTIRHLSPKAAYLRLKLDGTPLSSSELSVLPKPGQMIMTQAQGLPPVVMAAERGNQEISSGGGELSDSLSVGEVGVTRLRKKKAKSKVRVRRASISEPSDTDYEPRRQSSAQDMQLPHQKEIERMDSFREQLGEEWLRYQHHLEEAPPTTTSSATPDQPGTPAPLVQQLTNGLHATPSQPTPAPFRQPSPLTELPQVLPPPLLSSEPREEASGADAELETESTLQWSGHSLGHTESPLDSSLVEGLGSSTMEGGSGDVCEEEEEELGVDLCPPLLVGVLSEGEERGGRGGREGSHPVFLRVKQGLLLEVDMHRGQERARLELDCLGKVTTSEARWTEGEVEKVLPSLELFFRYISRERRRRRYVMLDDHPQQALEALSDVLSRVSEENERRVSEGRPGRVRLQCLRCGSEFSLGREEEKGGRGGRGRGRGALHEGGDHLEEEEKEEEQRLEGTAASPGSGTVCPECTSDHVVQLTGQSAPSTSTPVQSEQDTTVRNFTFDQVDTPQHGYRGSKDLSSDDTSSARASPLLDPPSTSIEDPSASFVTAEESSFFSGEGVRDTWGDRSLSKPVSFYSTGDQSREELAGSYQYSATPPAGALTPTQDHNHTSKPHATSPGHLDLLSEDYEAVDHRLKLFLDVEVFEEEEELHSFLKMTTVKFGDPEEFPSLLVVSNQRIYFLEMTSLMQGQPPTDWLQKRESHPITELSYLEVGLGSQSIHMEFEEGGVAYTLLIRDSARCKRFFGLLTGVVRELASKSISKLKSISTTRLTTQHHLWSLVCEDMQTDVEEGQLQFFYLLAYLHQEDSVSPLTVLATRETLYLLNEDHQWSKSLPNPLANENGEPCSGRVTVQETQPISCVSSVLLWSCDPCKVDIQLYDEILKQEKTWRLSSESPEQIQGLLVWVRAQWETMFGVKLTTSLQGPT
ncbi:serine/threonine-protein kinase 11-interacting protein [Hypomesus transpacificus]|uniref:serine/threonine-protein kinase 11-interacting protein n=1 Tax=Hypomesus transpacificus TaxID=137520 RepID=UPI001F07B60F|nr:serine/threonine-protein kinase 11-interacting protein [Hypomesus transpacificus]